VQRRCRKARLQKIDECTHLARHIGPRRVKDPRGGVEVCGGHFVVRKQRDESTTFQVLSDEPIGEKRWPYSIECCATKRQSIGNRDGAMDRHLLNLAALFAASDSNRHLLKKYPYSIRHTAQSYGWRMKQMKAGRYRNRQSRGIVFVVSNTEPA